MPAGFAFPVNEQIWIPNFTEFPAKDRNNLNAQGNKPNLIGLLRPDVSLDQANSEIATLASRLAQQFPESNKQFSTGLVEPLIKAFTPRQLAGLLLSMLAICVLGHLLSGLACLGLGLAALGISGVVARTVAQRTGEFGIRLALGAQREDLTRLVLTSGLKLALLGSALGLLGALGVSKILSAEFPGLHAHTFPVFLGVTLLLLAVALLASWLPARRAARLDPLTALRAE